MMDDSPIAWHDVGALGDLPPGAVREVVAGDQMVAVANVDGQVFAVDGICAHQGGPVGKGRLEGDCVTCPWHGWQYDVTTGRQRLSDTIALRRFPVRIEADRIEVCVESDRPA